MSRKHHGGPAPIPPGNKPHMGAAGTDREDQQSPHDVNEESAFQEHDPKRRLGDFTGTGEHSRQEPGRLNDGDTHSR